MASQFDGRDYYEVLGVRSGATVPEIQRAYRRLALKVHPDRLPASATSQQRAAATRDFQVLGRIVETLTDPDLRARYDEAGPDALDDSKTVDPKVAFRRVTKDDIEAYAERYRGSDEQRRDVLEAHRRFRGDWAKVLEWVPLSEPADLPRFRTWIKSDHQSNTKSLNGQAIDKTQGDGRDTKANAAAPAKGRPVAPRSDEPKGVELGRGRVTELGSRSEDEDDQSIAARYEAAASGGILVEESDEDARVDPNDADASESDDANDGESDDAKQEPTPGKWPVAGKRMVNGDNERSNRGGCVARSDGPAASKRSVDLARAPQTAVTSAISMRERERRRHEAMVAEMEARFGGRRGKHRRSEPSEEEFAAIQQRLEQNRASKRAKLS